VGLRSAISIGNRPTPGSGHLVARLPPFVRQLEAGFRLHHPPYGLERLNPAKVLGPTLIGSILNGQQGRVRIVIHDYRWRGRADARVMCH
jgi:hypothetical protein